VPDVLIASDESWVLDEVRSVLSGWPDVRVREVRSGALAVAAAHEQEPDLAILDLQIGNMGAMATTLELRLDESAGRLDHVPVLMLLDRRADVFLARRSGAEGFLVKPLDPIRLRRAVGALLEGERYEDAAYRPIGVVAGGGGAAAVAGVADGAGVAGGDAAQASG
jgi:DNA-binding NarL/FixJ family response regulator